MSADIEKQLSEELGFSWNLECGYWDRVQPSKLGDDFHFSPDQTNPILWRALVTKQQQIEELKRERDRLRNEVWRVRPNEDGEGGEKWRAFAADVDMQRGAAEQENASLRRRIQNISSRSETVCEMCEAYLNGKEVDEGWKALLRGNVNGLLEVMGNE